jgi:pimeloyl-ACP methyl ester carboxylesterase
MTCSGTIIPKLSWGLLCDDLEYLMNHLHLQSVHLIGHGIGYNIAVKTAIRKPSLVQALNLLSVPGFLPKGLVQQTLQRRLSLLTGTSRDQFDKSMVQNYGFTVRLRRSPEAR